VKTYTEAGCDSEGACGHRTPGVLSKTRTCCRRVGWAAMGQCIGLLAHGRTIPAGARAVSLGPHAVGPITILQRVPDRCVNVIKAWHAQFLDDVPSSVSRAIVGIVDAHPHCDPNTALAGGASPNLHLLAVAILRLKVQLADAQVGIDQGEVPGITPRAFGSLTVSRTLTRHW